MRSFETWTADEVCDTFGYTEIVDHPILMNWVETPQPEWTEAERSILNELKTLVKRHVEGWNEDELKMNLLSPILLTAHLNHEEYHVFSQRPLKARLNDIEFGGKVDFFVATGNQRPKTPYFFIHEYKQEKKYRKRSARSAFNCNVGSAGNQRRQLPDLRRLYQWSKLVFCRLTRKILLG